jgi:hypothetical protein
MMDGRVKPGHDASICYGPGSAEQREERCTASGTRELGQWPTLQTNPESNRSFTID